jgi:hypothetical protein
MKQMSHKQSGLGAPPVHREFIVEMSERINPAIHENMFLRSFEITMRLRCCVMLHI